MIICKNNTIPFKTRMRELFFDYLIILVYLILLFGVAMSVYIFLFKDIPKTSEFQAHLIALFTSVLPIVLIFSYQDYSKDGSIGKRKAGLKLIYKNKSIKASLIRNCIKFLPWQIGHMGTIHGVYTNFDSLAILLSGISITSGLLLCLMVFFRKDKRHLGDLLANTQVQIDVI